MALTLSKIRIIFSRLIISRLNCFPGGKMEAVEEPNTLDYLLAQVCHNHHFRANTLLEALGLYRGQPPVLFALWDQEGLTHTELAERLQNTPATITKMLQRMEKAGFVQRRADANDQRVSRVYLTETGRAIKAQVQAVWDTIEAETFAGFTDEESLLLRTFLQRIRQNLINVNGETL
jgi:MarR family transcriptional regulator, organic hydroperoxide resistance regulator